MNLIPDFGRIGRAWVLEMAPLEWVTAYMLERLNLTLFPLLI